MTTNPRPNSITNPPLPINNNSTTMTSTPALTAEIAHLETLLARARSKLPAPHPHPATPTNPTLSHTLLLLSDSALPLGSFAFSSGLESHLAHLSPPPHSSPPPSSPSHPLPPFLSLSLHSLSTSTLPYLLAAHDDARALAALDRLLDASTLCPVARRASVAQGRALLTVWERAFRGAGEGGVAGDVLGAFAGGWRAAGGVGGGIGGGGEGDAWMDELAAPSGHFAPLWAVVARAMGVEDAREAVYVFLFNHAKAVVSAAVRAGVLGPYQAQGLLGGRWLRAEIGRGLEAGSGVAVREAGQGVPAMDLWVGRHELLYSRIFNS